MISQKFVHIFFELVFDELIYEYDLENEKNW